MAGNAFGVDLAAGRRLRRVVGPARDRRLARIIVGDAKDQRIAEARGHAPHIGLGVRIGAGLVAKRLELRHQVILLLAGQPRKGRGDAAPVRAVARRAHMDGAGDVRRCGGGVPRRQVGRAAAARGAWAPHGAATNASNARAAADALATRHRRRTGLPGPGSSVHRCFHPHQNAIHVNPNNVSLLEAFLPAPS